MMLTIRGFPTTSNVKDIKRMITQQCKISDFILDQLILDNNRATKKLRVGVANEQDGSVLIRVLDGYMYNGFLLTVRPVGKDSKPNQPLPPIGPGIARHVPTNNLTPVPHMYDPYQNNQVFDHRGGFQQPANVYPIQPQQYPDQAYWNMQNPSAHLLEPIQAPLVNQPYIGCNNINNVPTMGPQRTLVNVAVDEFPLKSQMPSRDMENVQKQSSDPRFPVRRRSSPPHRRSSPDKRFSPVPRAFEGRQPGEFPTGSRVSPRRASGRVSPRWSDTAGARQVAPSAPTDFRLDKSKSASRRSPLRRSPDPRFGDNKKASHIKPTFENKRAGNEAMYPSSRQALYEKPSLPDEKNRWNQDHKVSSSSSRSAQNVDRGEHRTDRHQFERQDSSQNIKKLNSSQHAIHRSASRRSRSPQRRAQSPQRRSRSPQRRAQSPQRRSRSPQRRAQSPQRRSRSPKRRSRSLQRRSRSPQSSTLLSKRRSRSPHRRTHSPKHSNRSPQRRSRSPPGRRQRSPRDHHRLQAPPPPIWISNDENKNMSKYGEQSNLSNLKNKEDRNSERIWLPTGSKEHIGRRDMLSGHESDRMQSTKSSNKTHPHGSQELQQKEVKWNTELKGGYSSLMIDNNFDNKDKRTSHSVFTKEDRFEPHGLPSREEFLKRSEKLSSLNSQDEHRHQKEDLRRHSNVFQSMEKRGDFWEKQGEEVKTNDDITRRLQDIAMNRDISMRWDSSPKRQVISVRRDVSPRRDITIRRGGNSPDREGLSMRRGISPRGDMSRSREGVSSNQDCISMRREASPGRDIRIRRGDNSPDREGISIRRGISPRGDMSRSTEGVSSNRECIPMRRGISPRRDITKRREDISPNREGTSKRRGMSPRRDMAKRREDISPNRKDISMRRGISPRRDMAKRREDISPNQVDISMRRGISPRRDMAKRRENISPNQVDISMRRGISPRRDMAKRREDLSPDREGISMRRGHSPRGDMSRSREGISSNRECIPMRQGISPRRDIPKRREDISSNREGIPMRRGISPRRDMPNRREDILPNREVISKRRGISPRRDMPKGREDILPNREAISKRRGISPRRDIPIRFGDNSTGRRDISPRLQDDYNRRYEETSNRFNDGPHTVKRFERVSEELAQRVLDRHNIKCDNEQQARLCFEMRQAMTNLLENVFGDRDVTHEEIIHRYQLKYGEEDEERMFKNILSEYTGEFRSRIFEDPKDHAPVNWELNYHNVEKYDIDSDSKLKDSHHIASRWDIRTERLLQAPLGSNSIGSSNAMAFTNSYLQKPIMSSTPMFLVPDNTMPPHLEQHPYFEAGSNSTSDASLYICKSDFSPITHGECIELQNFLVTQVFEASSALSGWAPTLTMKGLQSNCRFEVVAENEKSRQWLLEFDFCGYRKFHMLVYTLEELGYERAAIWLPGHSSLWYIESLAKLQMQNKHINGINIHKWKLVKKIMTAQGTRIYIDIPPSSARVLEHCNMSLSYELQKVNVFLKSAAIDKDTFDMGLKDDSFLDRAELLAAIQNTPMPKFKYDWKVIRMCYKGRQLLTIDQASKVKEMLIYRIFNYHQNLGRGRTDFLKFGFCNPGYFAVLPENKETTRWLMSQTIGKLKNHDIVIVDDDYKEQSGVKVYVILPSFVKSTVPNVVLENLQRYNCGEKGINISKWKLLECTKSDFKNLKCQMTLEIDLESAEALQKIDFRLDYGKSTLRFQHDYRNFSDTLQRIKREANDSYVVTRMEISSD